LTPVRVRQAAFLFSFVAVGLVLLSARRPPVLDLAQQLDQIRLFGEVLAGERPDLQANLIAPNRLGYVPLGLAYLVASGAALPRLALLLVALAWLAAVHWMTARAEREPEVAVLASTLLLGSSFYAGFFNFLTGFVALAWWHGEMREERRRRSFLRILGSTLFGVLLLYLSHGLWLLVGGFAVATCVLLYRFRLVEFLARAAAVLLVVPLALRFAAQLEASGWQTTLEMLVPPDVRLLTPWVAASIAFGGVRGPLELLLFAVLVLWLVLAAITAFRRRGVGVDRFLVIAGSLFLLVAFFSPDNLDRTIFFAWRWGAPGFCALLIGLPRPEVRRHLAVVLACAALLLQSSVSFRAWRAFDREEMSGFEACLGALPERARVLGLDWQINSPRFRVGPYFQMFAWASLEREAEIGFSFADHGSSLVVRRDFSRQSRLGDFLVRNPSYLRPAHLVGYTHVIMHAEEAVAGVYVEQTDLLGRVAGGDHWQLLEVRQENLTRLPGALPATLSPQPIP